jgi:hypothetical protein
VADLNGDGFQEVIRRAAYASPGRVQDADKAYLQNA